MTYTDKEKKDDIKDEVASEQVAKSVDKPLNSGRRNSATPENVMSSQSEKSESTDEPGESMVVDIGRDGLSQSGSRGGWNLSRSELYLNRELTWLNFNRRVLCEAESEKNPLLERIKFLAIVSSNTDDFFMKRIGGFKQLIEAKVQELSVDGRTPVQQLHRCYDAIKDIEEKKSELFQKILVKLKQHDIYILAYNELSRSEKEMLRDFFVENIFPLLTPQTIDSAHPFPFISNLSLNLLVTLSQQSQEEFSLARIKIPVGPDIPRLIRVGNNGHYRFVMVEQIIRNNLDLLFPSMVIQACELFRVTRNANTEKDEDKADDLLEMIETELRDRKFAPIVRLQTTRSMNPIHRGLLCSELELNETEDVFEIDGMVGKRDLMELATLDIPSLKYKPHHPIDPPRLKDEPNIFYTLRKEGPILLFHPYESFTDSVERFLREASNDPKVRAIKMTLYRTSVETNVIRYLIDAVQKGKQVAVVVEIKARFDEAANIQWASKLEEKGIHVNYGVIGFKTHSKVILVVRKDYNGINLYSHIGTGNYHAGTARLYTDFGLLTCDQNIGRDLTELFNFLTTGCTPNRKYRKILVAPANLKREIIAKIDREIKLHSEKPQGLIQIKMNALEDKDIVYQLYRASQAGVKVDLIIRDTCRLRPGVRGLSETIRVSSIIGRFLEHSRLFYFRNGGDEEYYIGSADLMHRNLEKRIEVLTPIEDPVLQKEVRRILDIQLKDKASAWEMKYDGSYGRAANLRGKMGKRSQDVLIEIAEKRQAAARKIKLLQSKGKSKREFWSGH